MKILLTCRALREIGGAQSYIVTLANALMALGHEITFLGVPLEGEAAEQRWDLAVVSHHELFPGVRERCEKMISLCHGLIDMEEPSRFADHVVYVSTEARRYWKIKGGAERFAEQEARVILNPVDLGRFRPSPIPVGIPLLLRVSRYKDIPWLKELADEIGFEFKWMRKIPEWEKHAEHASIIVASGRCCYEAMACARPVIILDDRPYNVKIIDKDGPLADGIACDVYEHARHANCSGRAFAQQWGPAEMRHAILLAWGRGMETNRMHILANHDPRQIALAFLDLVGGE